MNTTVMLVSSLRTLQRNKMRSFLTALGIIIGVGAVVTMVALGQGASRMVKDQIASMGSNMIMVMPGSSGAGGVRFGAGSITTLTPDDAEAIAKECPAVAAVAPTVRGVAPLISGNSNWTSSFYGTSPDYTTVRDWPIDSGEMFTDADVRGAAKVCVVGQTVVTNLFDGQDPVGRTIRVKNLPFRVTGVLSAKGQNSFGQDQDDVVLMPYTTAQKKILGITHLNYGAFVSAASEDQVAEAQEQILSLIRQRHRIQPGQDVDVFTRSQTELAATQEQTSSVMTGLLASVASVSLVVGGIGIMNIMLVSVTERTREIGLRRALGAKRRDVLRQFLVEAVMLSVVGGLLGVALGSATSYLLATWKRWPLELSPSAMLVAFGFSALIGVFFGYYPARKAAHLSPIEALRYE
jgi:putative ABC transport system permease protein